VMAGVSGQLASTAVIDPFTLTLALVALVLLWRTRLNSAWFIAAGVVAGLAHTLITVR